MVLSCPAQSESNIKDRYSTYSHCLGAAAHGCSANDVTEDDYGHMRSSSRDVHSQVLPQMLHMGSLSLCRHQCWRHQEHTHAWS